LVRGQEGHKATRGASDEGDRREGAKAQKKKEGKRVRLLLEGEKKPGPGGKCGERKEYRYRCPENRTGEGGKTRRTEKKGVKKKERGRMTEGGEGKGGERAKERGRKGKARKREKKEEEREKGERKGGGRRQREEGR